MRTFIGVGSNEGDRRAHLKQAVELLPDVVAVSPVYESDPVGGPMQGLYLNLVIELDTSLSPKDLLGVCRRIESSAGRVRVERWGPRTLDLDIVWVEGVEMSDPQLTLPHPRWRERRFVLAPLRDLAPDLVSAKDVEMADGRVTRVEPLQGTGRWHSIR